MNNDHGDTLPLDDHLCYAVYSTGMAIQRIYKPLLDGLGLTYPQYLVLNVLWRKDRQSVGAIAGRLALESSTLTPLLKRLEAAGFVTRSRNPDNERQVVVALTPQGNGLRSKVACLGSSLLEASGSSPRELQELNAQLKQFRDALYRHTGEWGQGDAPGTD